MFFNNKHIFSFLAISVSCLAVLAFSKPTARFGVNNATLFQADSGKTTKKPRKKTAKPTFKANDRRGDHYSDEQSKSPLQLKDPSNIKKNTEFGDDSGSTYHVTETVADQPLRNPSEMTFEEYQKYRQEEARKDYWKEKASGGNNKKKDPLGANSRLIPPIVMNPTLDRIFGGNTVDIKPNGQVMLDFGGQYQRIDNPNVPVRLQRMSQFNFNQTIQFNVQGKIGEKMKVGMNWDTKAQFDFENNLKLDFNGMDYEIIKKIDAGNISFPLNTQLIQGSQNLFGARVDMQFGKLRVGLLAANQRGKSDQLVIQNGAQNKEIEIRADAYEDNKHYFLGQFFRNNYERALSNLPNIQSGVNITRVEVFVTNRTQTTDNTRNIVALMDLGENNPYDSIDVKKNNFQAFEDNNANDLYENATKNPNLRNIDLTGSTLESMGIEKVAGYEVVKTAKKLVEGKDYTVNKALGYISLTSQLRNDDVLAVSYEYTVNSTTSSGAKTVGELQDVYGGNSDGSQVIILKLLRPTTIRTDLPMWNLQMKNVYNINQSNVNRRNFQLRVIYKDDASGVDNPSIHEGAKMANKPLLQIFNLDNLNQNNDPQPDGNFDFLQARTIDSASGRVYFPYLEPFGKHLAEQFDPEKEPQLIEKYAFKEIYTRTKSDLLNFASKNKFFLRVASATSTSSDIQLPGLNIAKGSVRVTAGSTPLTEGVDYTVNYDQGRISIINQGAFASGRQIVINYEKADLFSFRQKSLTGIRLDYKYNKDINLGATMLHLNERPLITRVSIGDEPVSNTLIGLDATYSRESRILTKIIDKLPLISTSKPSNVSFQGEYAAFIPGSSKISKGNAYIDDFEGAENPFDLTRSPLRWKIGSTPSTLMNSDKSTLTFSYNRAKMAWFNIDNVFYTDGSSNKPSNVTSEDIKYHYVRAVLPQEIYPNRSRQQAQLNEPILDINFYPSERGPYNYNPNLKDDGTLNIDPKQSYAAITRSISTDTDFDNANIQYIEFWLMDPFLKGKYGGIPVKKKNGTGDSLIVNNTGGKLYFDLGSISEDVLKDAKQSFENGLPVLDPNQFEKTDWGHVPAQNYINDAFVTGDGARAKQDVGLDGLSNSEETGFFNSQFTNLSPSAKAIVEKDPSADDFVHYLDPKNTDNGLKIIDRYKNWNGTENNSPESSTAAYTLSSTNTPDNEDLNQNNTINDLEQYYEYEVDIRPDQLRVPNKYIVAKVNNTINGDTVSWYQFRIPIRDPNAKNVGGITDYKSIRFMRMYMTGWEQPVALRFAQLQMVAAQWRAYEPASDLNEKTAEIIPEPVNTGYSVSTVNIEENGQGSSQTSPYVVPPGFVRDRDNTSNVTRLLNEQSLRMCVDNLADGRARAVFKNTNFNFVNYGRLQMFMHAESQTIDPNDTTKTLVAFVRIGTDFTQNYYEIEIPLKYSRNPTNDPNEIWPTANELDISFDAISGTKAARNRILGYDQRIPYTRFVEGRNVTIVGNPDFSSAQVIMLGVKNPLSQEAKPYSACVWMNELRVSDFQNQTSNAAIGRLNTKLADFANVTASGKYMGIGFGNLEQKISQRNLNQQIDYGIQTNVQLDKFLPEKAGIRIPLFVSYDRSVSTPKYDPKNPDVTLDASLSAIENPVAREAMRNKLIDQSTRKSINVTNLSKVKTGKTTKSHLYDVENLSLRAGYSEALRTNLTLAEYRTIQYNGGLTYNYTGSPKNIEPLKKVKFLSNPYLKLIKEVNFTPLPSNLSFTADLKRNFQKTQNRNSNLDTVGILPQYMKTFNFDRIYAVNWGITKSLSLNYNATAYSLIDEPAGEINTKENKEAVVEGIKQFGRLKNYDQTAALNYKLPIDKFPLTDWISAETRYSAKYGWTAGSLKTAAQLGNNVQNQRDISINGKIDLIKLYNKVKFLKSINNPQPKPKPLPNDTTKPKPDYKLVKGFFRMLMTARSVNFTITEGRGIAAPGFMPKANIAGMDRTRGYAPGWEFVAGSQDVNQFLTRGVTNNWFSTDSTVNSQIAQAYTQSFKAQTQLEPFKEFKIQVSAQRDRTAKYSETFRYDQFTKEFNSLSPVRSGTFSISFIAVNTSFVRDNKDNSSPTFLKFKENINTIYDRLQVNNKSATNRFDSTSQDVIIPAFLAAYSGKSANSASLSAFPTIPLPNWNVTYAGLAQYAVVKKRFSSFTLNHAYTSTYNVGSYTNSALYTSDLINLNNSELDYAMPTMATNNRYTSKYIIPNVIIREAFSPLLGINFKTKKNFTGKIEYKKSRDVSLSVANAQVTEMKNAELVLGFGIVKSGLQLPIKIKGEPMAPLKNDVTFRFDVRFTDSKQVLRKLEGINTVTQGNILVSIKPNINYMVNQRLNLQIYYDQTINTPRVSTSFKRITTLFGIQLRFNLS